MKVAVLPFNAAEGATPALGRQIAGFVSESVRAATGADIHTVTYLAQVEQDGAQRAAFVNLSDGLVEHDFLKPFFEQSEADKIMDGLFEEPEGRLQITVRIMLRQTPEALVERRFDVDRSEIFEVIQQLVELLSEHAEVTPPAHLVGPEADFGTDDPEAFLKFLEGYDSFQYVQQANGMVAREFSPKIAYDAMTAAIEADPDFLGPYETLIALARACGQYRIGTFEDADAALRRVIEIVPDDFRAFFGLAELHESVGNSSEAANLYEKALALHSKQEEEAKEEGNEELWRQEQAAILSRLGLSQMNQGMPVNAERNFRKALEYETDEMPSLDFLSNVLGQTGREHEIPSLWKEQVDKYPEKPELHAKLAMALINSGREEEGVQTLESALKNLDGALLIKRVFASYLSAKSLDLDRAMDFYEDYLDENPTDVQVLLEYAQTLQASNREFEVPKVLETVLATTPDPNIRAQTQAWLMEVNEPKRAEAVAAAEKKMENGDFESAVLDLKPLRNWMSDYWKLWSLLAAAHNRLGQHEEAREAAERLIGIFPGFEPGYVELTTAFTALGRNEEAYNVMRYAFETLPRSIGIGINLALAAKRSGRDDEARNLARQIREAVGPNEQLEPIFAEIER
jgi:Flp pilus assembly protein TadD